MRRVCPRRELSTRGCREPVAAGNPAALLAALYAEDRSEHRGGIGIGAAMSLLVAPALATFLAGLSPADPTAFLAAAAILMLAAFVASYWPARRVARVDPLVALRH